MSQVEVQTKKNLLASFAVFFCIPHFQNGGAVRDCDG